MDVASAGDLQGALKRRGATLLPENTVIEWFAQICLGLKHVHDLSILHRCGLQQAWLHSHACSWHMLHVAANPVTLNTSGMKLHSGRT